MRPLRVAFSTLAPFISGAERSLQVMLRALPGAGVEPVVLAPPCTAMAAWCKETGLDFEPISFATPDKWHPLAWWSCVRRVQGILADRHVEVAHSNQLWSYPALGVAAARLGVATVCHLRDETSRATLQWWCRPAPDVLVAVSAHIATQARTAWPSPPAPDIITIVDPVYGRPLLPAAQDAPLRAAARAALQVPDDAFVFGFVGQLREVKGVIDLLEALATLPETRPWRLIVAGRDPRDGAPYEQACRARAAQPDLAGRVVFAGFLDDLSTVYHAVDVVVVPSREEPLGRVPLEAGTFGRPAIAAAVGGLPEVVRHGETGWLVPSSDVPALREELAAHLRGERPALGPAAHAWATRTADPAAYAERVAEVHRRLRPHRA
jgi:glycosyltransferase involved in cell wall biosynthesis